MKILDMFKKNKLENKLEKLTYVLDLITQNKEGFEVLDDIRMNLTQIRHKYQDNPDIYDAAGFILDLIPTFEEELLKWKAERSNEGE